MPIIGDARVRRGRGSVPARALADAVNARGLYRKRDGSPVEVNQVHARTNNYQDLFEKNGSLICLRTESRMLADHPQAITVFKDDDRGFFDWLGCGGVSTLLAVTEWRRLECRGSAVVTARLGSS